MRKIILNKALLFIIAGLAYAVFGHYLLNGFNQPIDRNEFIFDFLFFGSLMVILKIIEEQIKRRKGKANKQEQNR